MMKTNILVPILISYALFFLLCVHVSVPVLFCGLKTVDVQGRTPFKELTVLITKANLVYFYSAFGYSSRVNASNLYFFKTFIADLLPNCSLHHSKEDKVKVVIVHRP